MGFRLPALNPNKPEHLRKRQTEASRRYRAKYKAKISAANRRIYWVRRERALTLLGGPHCAVCGCDEIKFLEINHINGGGAKEYRARNRGLTDIVLAGTRHTEDLNVLCRVCNALDFLRRKHPDAVSRFEIRWQKFTGREAVREDGTKYSDLVS